MAFEDYIGIDIDLFQRHELFVEDIILDIDTWLTESLLTTLSDGESYSDEDRSSLLNSDIISVNSLAISSADDSDSSSQAQTEKITLSSSSTPHRSQSSADIVSDDVSTLEECSSIISNPTVVYGAEMFPILMSEAFNQGDHDYVRSIISAYISDKCIFNLIKPVYSYHDYGSVAVMGFFDQTLEKCPDAIILYRGMKKIPAPERKGYYLKIKTHMSGIMADKTDLCGAKETLAELASPKRSKSDIEAIRLAEMLIRQQQKHIQIFCKGFTYLFIDEVTNKIEHYDISLSLTSIRGAAI